MTWWKRRAYAFRMKAVIFPISAKFKDHGHILNLGVTYYFLILWGMFLTIFHPLLRGYHHIRGCAVISSSWDPPYVLGDHILGIFYTLFQGLWESPFLQKYTWKFSNFSGYPEIPVSLSPSPGKLEMFCIVPFICIVLNEIGHPALIWCLCLQHTQLHTHQWVRLQPPVLSQCISIRQAQWYIFIILFVWRIAKGNLQAHLHQINSFIAPLFVYFFYLEFSSFLIWSLEVEPT